MDSLKPTEIEELSYDECVRRVEMPLLKKQMGNIACNSEFYKEKYLACGLDLEEVSDIDCFSKLPFTEKHEVIAEQEKHPPYGRLTDIPGMKEMVRRVHFTSGTSGRPVYIALTENDLEHVMIAGARAFSCASLSSEDTVIHCLNYSLWAGGVTDHMNLERTGATVIPFGVGNSKKLIETILELKPTAISCTPSYLSKLELVLKKEFSMDPKDLGLKKGLFAGEAGIQNPKIRKRIEDRWGLAAIDANYGMSDVLSIFGSECSARDGLHFHGQGIVYMELIDPDSACKLEVKTGQIGELVLTNLVREAQPLIRFRTRDIIEIVSTEPCECGRKSLRFNIIGRSDDMITVRGVNVYPNAVGTIITDKQEWFSGEFQFIIETPPPIERPVLHVELASTCVEDTDVMESFLVRECKQKYNFTPAVKFIKFGEFARTEGKTKRIVKMY